MRKKKEKREGKKGQIGKERLSQQPLYEKKSLKKR